MLRCRSFCLSVVFYAWTAVAATGDASRGESLFVGRTFSGNGGAPCLACHNLSGFGMASDAMVPTSVLFTKIMVVRG